MSRTQKLMYNSFSAALYSITSVVIGLILPRLIISTYGSDINGLTVSIKQFITYLKYLEAGLAASFIYALYKPLVNKQYDNINDLVSQAKKTYDKTSLFYFIGVCIISSIYPLAIHLGELHYLTITLLVFAIGFFGVLELYSISKYKVLLFADQKAYIMNYMSLIALIINLGLSVILIKNNASIILVMLVPSISLIIRSIFLKKYIKKNYSFVNYKGNKESTISLNKRFDAMLMEISKTINLSLPIIFLTIFSTLQLISVYSIYNLVFNGLKTVIQVITTGASASFGEIIAKGETDKLKNANEEFEVMVYAVLSFLYSSTLVLIIPFITVYVSGFNDSQSYINLLYGLLFVIWGYFHNARLPHTTLIAGGGLYRQARNTNIFQILLLAVLLLWLVPKYHIMGALSALIISAIYKTFAMIIITKREIIKSSVWGSLIRLFRGIVIIIISYIPFIFINLVPESFLQWFYVALLVALWCALVTVGINIIFDRLYFLKVLKRLKKSI